MQISLSLSLVHLPATITTFPLFRSTYVRYLAKQTRNARLGFLGCYHSNLDCHLCSIVGSVLVSCGVIAVVVPKWLKTDESDELADDEDEDYDDGVEQRNDNNNTNININHSPHSHAPEMPQLPANNDNKIRHQLADNNNNNNNNDEESSSQDCRLSASKTASSNCQPSRDEKTQA